MNILVARSQVDGQRWMERLHTDRAQWIVVGCVSIPESVRGYRPEAIFITPMARYWLSDNGDGRWLHELQNRAPTFTISD